MRISTQSYFAGGVAGISDLQQQIFKTQQKLAAGTKFLTPSDDPVAAARALGVGEAMAEQTQYANSRGSAVLALSTEESALQQGTDVLQQVKTLIVQAGDGTLADADRTAIATQLESNFAQLLSVANKSDGNGQYLFAGFKSSAPPFVEQGNGSVSYGGDQGQRLMQVDVARQMAGGDNGVTVFQSVQGSAEPVPQASPANTGSGVMHDVSVTDGKSYTVTFLSGNYIVSDGSGNPPVTVAAGQPIQVGGLHMSISGTPADNDSFTVTQATVPAQADVFQALRDVITCLKAPVTGAVADAALQNALSTANVKISNAHDNILAVRASVGSRLAELDALNASGQDQNMVNQKYLSELQDLDYTSAITEFSQRQTNLQATEQTFARLQGISLFNYLT